MTIMSHGNNDWSLSHMRNIIELALKEGYQFMTCREFMKSSVIPKRTFILKHDLDTKPETLPQLLNLELDLGVRSTVFVRTSSNEYNLLDYRVLPMLMKYEALGVEIGLHTNFVEYAVLTGLRPEDVLNAETTLLKTFFNVSGMSTHRDLNYAYNSLPYVEECWPSIKNICKFDYQAYDPKLMENTIYVNEGYSPHLCWRNLTPEQAILTHKNVYMLTHNHWWWKNHPWEL